MYNSNRERAGNTATSLPEPLMRSVPRSGRSVSYGDGLNRSTNRDDANFIRQLSPENLESDEECSSALVKIEEAIAKIETQLEYGGEEDWARTARAALRLTRAKRTAVIRRREDLFRKWKAFRAALESRFGFEAVEEVWKAC